MRASSVYWPWHGIQHRVGLAGRSCKADSGLPLADKACVMAVLVVIYLSIYLYGTLSDCKLCVMAVLVQLPGS
jgi:hypothetical protein